MSTSVKWTREHTLAAFHLYTLLPFGRLDQRTPEIQQLAAWEGRTPSSVAMKLVNFASLDPQIVATGRAGLNRATNQDRALWAALQRDWDAVAIEAADAYAALALSHGVQSDKELLQEDAAEIEEGRTRSAIVQVRVNQARFRKSVLTSYNATCCISGLRHEKLVIASHIVPWSKDTKNRLNPQNGLCLAECNLHTIVRLPNGVFAPYTGIKTNLLFFTKGTPTKEVWYYEHPYPAGVKNYNKTKPIRIEEFDAEKAWWGSEADGFAGRIENQRAWKVSIEQIKAAGYNLDQKNPHADDAVNHDPEQLLADYACLKAEAQTLRNQLKTILAESLEGRA